MIPFISLAPMEGVTTYIFRNALNKYYPGVDEYYSPFITGRTLSFKELSDISPENNKSLKLIPQVLTNNPETFFEIEAQLKDLGYTCLNINLGCPSGTMVAKGRGAGQLKNPNSLKTYLDKVFEKTSMTISIKTRIGMSSTDEWPQILEVYKQFPVSKLIIHPRLQCEFYNGLPHREAYKLAQSIIAAPLSYNGNITSMESFADLINEIPAVNDIMIGRGLISNPTLSAKLKNCPSNEDIKHFKNFHDEILNEYCGYMSGDQPVLYKMKELWVYMRDYVSLADKDMKLIKKTNSLSEYRSVINRIIV